MMTLTHPLHRLAACAALSLILATPLAGQVSHSARLQGRVPANIHSELVAVIDSAQRAGLPAEPLVQKALEGSMKRAAPARISTAVRTLAAELRIARQALGSQATDADLVAAANALHAGVPVEVLRKLRRDRQREPLTIALGVMTELIARGVPAAQASSTVLAMVESGAREEALVAFGRDVERDIGMGAPPAVATEIRSGGVMDAAAADRGGLTSGSATQPAPPKPRKP
jgi:hypothetical protein